MSWQAYVDSSLVGSGHIDKAAIISVAGDSVWATSSGFTIKPEEMKNIANIVTQSAGAVEKAQADGIHVAGERYVAFRIEERSVYGRQGRTGVVIVKTKQAIIVGHYGEAHVAGNSTQTVEALADYLIKAGY
ncbi:Profilin [Daldinia childiae]|uniref:Profilin n=1 Tax=Daldinia childiae TaxID=326645 RepID=UPI001447D8AD|nr:Profilin [Daldinia childiae]KAF3055884.1 Profilin [Daldinia childiae]